MWGRRRDEGEVGITEYIREGGKPRISALIKERFSDFHVREVDPQGRIVRLTTTSAPEQEGGESEELFESINHVVGEDVRCKFNEGGVQNGEKVEIKVTEADKDVRTKIHRWIASFSNPPLSSETIDKGDDKYIVVSKGKGNPRNRRRPADRKRYTHCVLYKEGWETGEAVNWIAKKLNLKPGLISYAGIKDKRAKTTQRVAVSNIEAERLVGICRYSKNIKLGNFEYKDRPIALGNLGGNNFQLLLKDVKFKEGEGGDIESVLVEAVNSLRTKGFINYYGLQRFGSYEVSTWQIGKEVLCQRWVEAFDLILQVKPNDPPWMVEAKELWLKHRDAQGAVKKMNPKRRNIESHLLHGLARYYMRNDFVNTFTNIPRNQRLLYVHAFQSYVWNKMASYRVKEDGLNVVVGDLVYASCAKDAEDNSEETDVKNNPDVKLLTEQDVASGKYNVYDVLLPLYGSGVTYVDGSRMKDFLDRILKEEGIPDDALNKFRPVADKPTGGYRKLIVLPKDVSHEIKKYSEGDNLDCLISSDWEIMCKADSESNGSTTSNSKENSNQEVSNKVKDKSCVVLSFSLPSSSYATMALREILVETEFSSGTGTNDEEPNEQEDADDEDEPLPKKAKCDPE